MPGINSALVSGQTGIYGKVSSHGDFVLRRLPQEFVAPWDEWLQQGITKSRQLLGAAWEETYGRAPVWRFLLPPGVCGDTAWAGLMQPSVDRVGRYFPLTVAAALPGNINALETMMNAGDWYAELEREAAAAFDADVQLGALDQQLQQLSFPEHLIVYADVSDDTLPGGGRDFSALKVEIHQPVTYGRFIETLDREHVVVGPFDCIWSGVLSRGKAVVMLLTKALPLPARFCAMLDGQWGRCGWDVAAPDVVVPGVPL